MQLTADSSGQGEARKSAGHMPAAFNASKDLVHIGIEILVSAQLWQVLQYKHYWVQDAGHLQHQQQLGLSPVMNNECAEGCSPSPAMLAEEAWSLDLPDNVRNVWNAKQVAMPTKRAQPGLSRDRSRQGPHLCVLVYEHEGIRHVVVAQVHHRRAHPGGHPVLAPAQDLPHCLANGWRLRAPHHAASTMPLL